MATSSAMAGRPNEDFAAAVPGAVVVLDGAGIPGSEGLCSHGVAWYTHRLGGALLSRLSRDERQLGAILADAIDETTAEHRGTCDVADPSSPHATVLIVRLAGKRLDHLLLADSTLVLDRAGVPDVVTDGREVAARRVCASPLDGVPPGTPEHDRIWASCAEAMRARRNQPGGYWIAKDDPRAAQEAVSGSCPLDDLTGAALLSNGASRVVDRYAVTDWAGVLRLLRAGGADELVRLVRRTESERDVGAPDDATVVYCTQLNPADVLLS